ncbi:hypothetical protein EVAR_37006_1 [Eumeta japonica]|uniref:Uncharacterized protein n=1 Tax=Eumeta variegata TaxID=151549 RepID=A0A4C1X105_EUMVA|nr:hypothetical protein EVAR_37006_1 [Eumeta japonica]
MKDRVHRDKGCTGRAGDVGAASDGAWAQVPTLAARSFDDVGLRGRTLDLHRTLPVLVNIGMRCDGGDSKSRKKHKLPIKSGGRVNFRRKAYSLSLFRQPGPMEWPRRQCRRCRWSRLFITHAYSPPTRYSSVRRVRGVR